MFFLKLIRMVAIYFILAQNVHAYALLKDVNGQQIPFNQLKGKWVFIHYWANWCQSCVKEISELNRFYSQQKNKVSLFAVHYDALPLRQQLQLIKKYHIHYPSLREDPAQQLHLGSIAGVPATFIFNPQGQFVRALYGPQTRMSLNKIILKHS